MYFCRDEILSNENQLIPVVNKHIITIVYASYLDSGLGWAAILGIVLGCVAFIVIVLVLVVILCYVYNRRDYYKDRYSRAGGRGGRDYYGAGYPNRGYQVSH